MFEVLKDAGLTPSTIARLLNVSRVAVSLWVNGHSKPHSLLKRRVDKLLQAIQSAVDCNDLPLSEDVPRRNRFAETSRIIYRHLEKLKLGSVSE